MSSQRHKCVEHNYTVLAAGACPAYTTPTYPDYVQPPEVIPDPARGAGRKSRGNADSAVELDNEKVDG